MPDAAVAIKMTLHPARSKAMLVKKIIAARFPGRSSGMAEGAEQQQP
jgi:hypothetical protein